MMMILDDDTEGMKCLKKIFWHFLWLVVTKYLGRKIFSFLFSKMFRWLNMSIVFTPQALCFSPQALWGIGTLSSQTGWIVLEGDGGELIMGTIFWVYTGTLCVLHCTGYLSNSFIFLAQGFPGISSGDRSFVFTDELHWQAERGRGHTIPTICVNTPYTHSYVILLWLFTVVGVVRHAARLLPHTGQIMLKVRVTCTFWHDDLEKSYIL